MLKHNIKRRSWLKKLDDEIKSPYFKELMEKLKYEYAIYDIFPPKNEIFAAYNLLSFKDIKVVIIGQDPYHGLGQANGLAFSVNKTQKIPPSLRNIYKELCEDLKCTMPNHGDLTEWITQGVFLLNATLTVRRGNPNSHADYGWSYFTDATIHAINEYLENVVFILLGKFAQSKCSNIDTKKHRVLTSAHPYSEKNFFGNHIFSKANKYLIKHNKEPINWQITNVEN